MQECLLLWLWSAFSFTNLRTISDHKLALLRKEVETDPLTLIQGQILEPHDGIHRGICRKSLKGTICNGEPEGPLLGGRMPQMWEVMQAMPSTGTGSHEVSCPPAFVSVFISLMLLEHLMFSEGLSHFFILYGRFSIEM